jgi:hypothetical protein
MADRWPPPVLGSSGMKASRDSVCFLRPNAVVLMWIDLVADRPDWGPGGKLA